MCRVRVIKAAAAAALASSLLLVFGLGLSACGSDDATLGHAGNAPASDQAVTEESKQAPDFSGPTLGGKTVSLAQYRGKPLILIYTTPT